ncbi:unnamed protein product [Gongylonema pulchrum]|uniref:DUF4139 domain-containing protein n=1 Tax=Gongylonema pulchrum TaxID=637853 RepID=A0A183ECV2_9BILA|nr:unnamed protein product [Gongylonema pulchrum]
MATTDNIVGRHTFNAHDLKITSVIVYLDRAEVKRSLKASLAAGVSEVIVEVQELRNSLKKLEEKQKNMQDQKKIAEKSISVLDSIIEKSGKAMVKCEDGASGHSVAIGEILENISKLVSYHEQGHAVALTKIRQLDEDLRQLDEEIRKTEEQINQTQHHKTHVRSICLLLESNSGGDVELDVSYQVPSASWRPSYEIRVQSATNTLKLSYFGQIQQNTGEDWLDTSLILSTARPSFGATTPRLGTLNAEFYKPPPPRPKYHYPLGAAGFTQARRYEQFTACES